MNKQNTAIAEGRLAMINYLEGKQIYIDGKWQTVKNSRVQGVYGTVNIALFGAGMLEQFCREARDA